MADFLFSIDAKIQRMVIDCLRQNLQVKCHKYPKIIRGFKEIVSGFWRMPSVGLLKQCITLFQMN